MNNSLQRDMEMREWSKMKKMFFILITALCLLVIGCESNDNPVNGIGDKSESITLTIYTLNDFHGAILESGTDIGINKLGTYLKQQKANNPDTTLIISAGDMFQGTAISSLTKGQVVVDAMNEIGFDAMTLGNHEFDWGIEHITRYHDKDINNGEANFPFLGSNIFVKSTGEEVKWANPYVVIEKGSYKIGIIGTIGEAQTSDILETIISPYTFGDQITAIKKYAKILREEEKCDVVILSAHDGYSYSSSSVTGSIADKASKLEGVYAIDAVINGHTHSYYAGEIRKQNGYLPYIQAGDNGVYIGKICLELDGKTRTLKDVSAENLRSKDVCKKESSVFQTVINKYQSELEISSEVLGISNINMSRDIGAAWAADVMQKHAAADLGIINYGGIRSAGFPINKGQTITYGNVFQISPFDNLVRTVRLTGKQLLSIVEKNRDSLVYSSNFNITLKTLNGKTIDINAIYTVATIDYVFEKSHYCFNDGIDIVNTGVIFRDYLALEIKEIVTRQGSFSI